LLVFVVLASGCAGQQAKRPAPPKADPVAPEAGQARLDAHQNTIATRLAHIRRSDHGSVCARFPPQGPSVVLVSSSALSERRARRYLDELHILNGQTERLTSAQVFNREYALIERMQRTRPKGFIASNVVYEFPTHELRCPVARIYLGPKNAAPVSWIRWAQSLVRQYGTDRVIYEYQHVTE
jgi:hypothetical protein